MSHNEGIFKNLDLGDIFNKVRKDWDALNIPSDFSILPAAVVGLSLLLPLVPSILKNAFGMPTGIPMTLITGVAAALGTLLCAEMARAGWDPVKAFSFMGDDLGSLWENTKKITGNIWNSIPGGDTKNTIAGSLLALGGGLLASQFLPAGPGNIFKILGTGLLAAAGVFAWQFIQNGGNLDKTLEGFTDLIGNIPDKLGDAAEWIGGLWEGAPPWLRDFGPGAAIGAGAFFANSKLPDMISKFGLVGIIGLYIWRAYENNWDFAKPIKELTDLGGNAVDGLTGLFTQITGGVTTTTPAAPAPVPAPATAPPRNLAPTRP